MISDRAAKCPKCGCPVVKMSLNEAPTPRVEEPVVTEPAATPPPVPTAEAEPTTQPQQPQTVQPQCSPPHEPLEQMPQQPQERQGRGKNIAIVLLSVVLVVVVVVLLILLLRDKDTPAETARILSRNVEMTSSNSASDTNRGSASDISSASGGNTYKISGSKRYDGDIEGIKCYFTLYFEAKDGGVQDVSGSYYYKKSGSDHPLGLRGTYNEDTGVLFLREYLEDGSPHASMEVAYNKYSGNFYGTFTRYTGERMSISMRCI